jgi:hypothetical protein
MTVPRACGRTFHTSVHLSLSGLLQMNELKGVNQGLGAEMYTLEI